MTGQQVQCNDGCKRTQPDDDAATAAGWRLLDIQKRWRCPDCRRELEEANRATALATVAANGPPFPPTGTAEAVGTFCTGRDLDLRRGAIIRHVPTGATYRVEGRGKLRLPGGGWVHAVRYVPAVVRPHERDDVEYYRAAHEFQNFVKGD